MSQDLLQALSQWLADDVCEKGFRGQREMVRHEAVQALQALSLAQIAMAMYDEPQFQTPDTTPRLRIVDSEIDET